TGMSREVQAHAFDAFFTTKGPDKGTGLGLSTVRDIVKECNGEVVMDSAPGLGTSFRVYLPRARQEDDAPSPDPASEAPPRGNEAVLVVDDEEAVRSAARRALGAAGFRVVEAKRAQDAIEHLETHPSVLDLVVADVVLPEMSG